MANGDNKNSSNNNKSSYNKKPEPSTGILDSTDPIEVIGFLLLTVVIVGVITERIVSFATGDEPFTVAAYNFFLTTLSYVIPISILISGLFIFGLYHSVKNLGRVTRELKLRFHSHKAGPTSGHVSLEHTGNKKWDQILRYLDSNNVSDWKIAILEADIMLEEMVDRIGYPGETLGDKLKNVEKSDFNTVDKAWEAHKIRNTIAHEGQAFTITQGEARRVMGLFEEVFKEFRYI